MIADGQEWPTHLAQTVCEHGKKVKQSVYWPITGPEGFRRLRLPDFKTIGA
jgi:hypothetical protein